MNVTKLNFVLSVCAFLIAAAPSFGSFSGTDVVLPSVGQGPGSSESQWNTVVWIHNPNPTAVNVQFFFVLRNQPNPIPASTFSVSVAAGRLPTREC